jgi:energy-coupling factor transporter ATP-binding protein EcfA2
MMNTRMSVQRSGSPLLLQILRNALDARPPFSSLPRLSEVLLKVKPLPQEALFLGQAEDGLPVLLNLHDPSPGPVLIVGKPGTGKTDLLRVMAQFIISTHKETQTQFAVITSRVDEWQENLSAAATCVGVFAGCGPDAERLVQSIPRWMASGHGQSQAVLLLIDGLENALRWDRETLASLQQILLGGPEKRVWPIATLTPDHDLCSQAWTRFFRLQIVQPELLGGTSYSFAQHGQRSDSGFNRPCFAMQEQGHWLKFWIPALDE